MNISLNMGYFSDTFTEIPCKILVASFEHRDETRGFYATSFRAGCYGTLFGVVSLYDGHRKEGVALIVSGVSLSVFSLYGMTLSEPCNYD